MAIDLGIVGCGDISHFHARAIEAVSDKIHFTACCDVDRERAEEWATQYDVSAAYGSLEEMLRAETLDAVLLATWPNLHRSQIEFCLNSGIKQILCEKALAITGSEATEIWDMVQNADAFLMEGFMYRHPQLAFQSMMPQVTGACDGATNLTVHAVVRTPLPNGPL